MVHPIVVAGSQELNDKVAEDLSRNRLYSIFLANSSIETIRMVQGQKPHLVILNFDVFTPKKKSLIVNLKEMGYSDSILVLAKFVSADSAEAITALDKCVLIERPYVANDFYGVVGKLVSGHDVRQRVHRRFFTNQKAHIVPFSGQEMNSILRNLSRGGALIEYDGTPVEKGEILRVKVDLKDLSKSYNVHAKVVWSEPKDSGPSTIGVEFIKAGDIYRNLLQKI
ncbi:MAG: hypothetical protein COT74_09490 [Bdellovibrionales bacterium CG10_big_fil_rev_8_21_14_0_10_45_34]|nr:MAG: hypothetical protein COT74_09490 [Bdellovibrionales bacterium CG10_big_fil_rev_8_21_14_0_10_45_34]